MSKAKFQAARELIEEKNYDAARRVLRSMRNEPQAKEWLRRLPGKTWWQRARSVFVPVLVFFFGVYVGMTPARPAREMTTPTKLPTAIAAVSTPTTEALPATPSAVSTTQAVSPTLTETPTPDATATASRTTAPTQTNIPTNAITPTPTTSSAQLTQVRLDANETMAALNVIAQATNAALPTAAPVQAQNPPAIDEAEYTRLLYDGLFILAGGRNIQSVRVPINQTSGAASVIVTYLTTESTEVGVIEEWIDLFSATAATIRANSLQVIEVALITGTPSGSEVVILVTSISDLLDFHEGRISQATFIARLTVTQL